jgi:hypothetical protein
MKLILAQGNIFEQNENFDLIIVFGHIGFNQMSVAWSEFKVKYKRISDISDPFINEMSFIQYTNNKFFCTINEKENHGIGINDLFIKLAQILDKALKNKIKSIIFNGASNIDKTTNSIKNRNSDNQRAKLIINFLTVNYVVNECFEKICLISLNDIYKRNEEVLLENQEL